MIPVIAFKSALKWFGLAAAALALVGAVYTAGQRAGKDAVQSRWNDERADYEEQRAALQDLIRNREQAHRGEVSRITSKYHAEVQNVRKERDDTIADLQSGERRLRDRLKAQPSGVPQAPGGASGSDEAGEVGLSGTDAEFLIRLSAEADEVAEQLTSCQRILDQTQKLLQ